MWKKGLLIFFLTQSAWAYNLTQDFKQGFYWASLPITIHVDESDKGRKDTIEQLARDAMGEWESRTGLTIWSMDTGTSNIIRWSNNFAAETKMDPVSVLAVAIRYTNGPYFAKTEIVINGSHPLNHELNHLLTTITHELGHTMGLDHSENLQALMAPTLQDPYMGLHSDDIRGMTEASQQTEHRQLTKYVSPLAYEQKETKQPISCGSVGVVGPTTSGGILSMAMGMLIAFVRKILKKFKSLL